MSELEKLKAQNTELSDRIAKLEAAAKPPEPFVPMPMPRRDPTEGMSMDRETMREMVRATSGVMADLRADARTPNPVTEASSSTVRGTPAALSQPQQRGTGWRDEIPLSSPPGVAIADKLMDAQDRIDRAELAMRLAKASMGEEKK
jgi:hypothetical protein